MTSMNRLAHCCLTASVINESEMKGVHEPPCGLARTQLTSSGGSVKDEACVFS